MADGESSKAQSDHTEASRAEILAPGPVLAIGAIGLGYGLHLLVPLSVFPTPWNAYGGGLLVIAGLAILFSGIHQMRQIGKSPAHSDEPTQLLTKGPFKYTRNPLYLGLLVISVGVTALLNTLWPLLPIAGLAWYFDKMAKREEEYLEAVFGEEFVQYTEEVRRWI